MSELPSYGLANTVTGFATLFAGCSCLALSRLVRRQPRHWRFAYWSIVVTGVFTITLHGFGETLGGPGPRWFWSFLDTGSNIVVAWALALAALADYYEGTFRRSARAALSALMILGVAWHFYDRLPSTESAYLIPLGSWDGFHPGESWLIAMSLAVVALFVARRQRIPAPARPLLGVVCGIFLVGMLLATGSNEQILWPFLAIHALWHVVGAFGFVFLWAFNHVCVEEKSRAANSGNAS